MHQTNRTLLAWALLATAAFGFSTDINLSVQSGGSNTITAMPGEVLNYEVVGELSNLASDGLALVIFDLSFSGGALTQADSPNTFPMSNFAKPWGITNPAGYGGTLQGGVLRQVGGGQNTINNFFAAYPIGSVVTNVAQAGSPQVLATGSVTMPLQPGSYTLTLSNPIANVIRQGETGFPFWRVDGAGIGTVLHLQINVPSLTTDVDTLSIGSPGTQTFFLDAGPDNAGRTYFLLGSVTGTAPGTAFPFTTLPLNYDLYTAFTITGANGAVLGNTLGVLNGSGKATATFTLPPGVDPRLEDLQFFHAFVLTSPVDFASNPVTLILTL